MKYHLAQADSINVPADTPAAKGVHALRVVDFDPGAQIAIGSPSNKYSLFANATYHHLGGDSVFFVAGTGRVIFEYSQDPCAVLEPLPPVAQGQVQLPTIVAAGSSSGVPGADMNSDDWGASNVRYTPWVDVSAFMSLQLISNVQTLAGINAADTVQPQIEYSSNGLEAVGAVPMAAGGVGGAGVYGGTPSANKNWVASRFARIKLSKGALGGPLRMRVQWWGQLS